MKKCININQESSKLVISVYPSVSLMNSALVDASVILPIHKANPSCWRFISLFHFFSKTRMVIITFELHASTAPSAPLQLCFSPYVIENLLYQLISSPLLPLHLPASSTLFLFNYVVFLRWLPMYLLLTPLQLFPFA